MLSLQSKQHYLSKITEAKKIGEIGDEFGVSRVQQMLGLCYTDSLSLLEYGVEEGVFLRKDDQGKCFLFS